MDLQPSHDYTFRNLSYHEEQPPVYELHQLDPVFMGGSCMIDELAAWIDGPTPYDYFDSCERIQHWRRAAERHRSALSSFPGTISRISHAPCSWPPQNIAFRTVVLDDFAKLPYHAVKMVAASSLSLYNRIKAERKVLEEIMRSLSQNLTVILSMVTGLGLETKESVEREIKDRGFGLYLTLARLSEAYRSRSAPSGSLYLASNKRLLKYHCHGMARLHFDHIHKLKSDLMLFHLSPAQPTADSLDVWLGKALPALKQSSVDSGRQDQPSSVLQRLRNTRVELSDLLLRS